MAQLGAPHAEIILPPFTPIEPRPDYPVEVDDQYILPHQILGQPEGTVSRLTGFVRAIKVYEAMTPLVCVELSYAFASLRWDEQKEIMFGCLREAKAAIANMPPELYMDMDTPPPQPGASTHTYQDAPGFEYHPPAYPAPQPQRDIRRVLDSNPVLRRQLQYEIQKANIYVSQLATRSHFVERYFNFRENRRENPDPLPHGGIVAEAAAAVEAAEADHHVEETMRAERELIVKNLLVVITSISQQNMEPNGASLINKIRQVASTLLNDAPDRKGPVAKQNEQYLARFLGILTRLEKTVPANAGTGGLGDRHGQMSPQDEEDELRIWADLHEHQMRFANQGGFLIDN